MIRINSIQRRTTLKIEGLEVVVVAFPLPIYALFSGQLNLIEFILNYSAEPKKYYFLGQTGSDYFIFGRDNIFMIYLGYGTG
ncbi:hypothetical protein HYS94_01050 [Candidatus Daviesbacteria bacterium]|nr:hypothetical protein [Candidatus Daviesbacteria bacterium]